MEKDKNYWEKERERCLEDPHYFYITYFTISGKPAKTILTKEVFNSYFKDIPVPAEAHLSKEQNLI